MKLKLEIGGLEVQPQWWQNFIADIDSRYDHTLNSDERTNNIHTEIKKVGAKPFYRYPADIRSIKGLEFENDADCTWFLLRWS